MICFLKLKTKIYLNSSELIHSEIYFLCTDDLSHGKIATQSQTYTGINFDASRAVDGNTATCMRTNGLLPRTKLHGGNWILVECTAFTALP